MSKQQQTNTKANSRIKTIGEICTFTNGHGFRPRDWDKEGLPIIRIQNLNGSTKFNYFSGDPDPKWLVERGDLLFAWAGTQGVSFGPTIWEGKTGVLNQHIYRIHPNSDINKEWLLYALSIVTSRIEQKAHGFKSTLLHVHKNDITSQRIYCPELSAQNLVVNTLSYWTDSIKILERIIQKKTQQHASIKQQLLSGGIRLPKFKKSWTYVRFSDVFNRINRKNSIGNKNVLTISGRHGLVDQQSYYNKSVSGSDITGYILLKKGEFSYNRSTSNGYPYGAIKRLERFDFGVVSTLYICFALKSDHVDSNFMQHYFEAGLYNREIYKVAQEGARSHGLLNVGVHDFFNGELRLPPLDEQKRISKILNIFDTELENLRSQLELLKRQKQGLMQQLLTGKIPVKTK